MPSMARAACSLIAAAFLLPAADLEKQFAAPPQRYGPSCFWWWFGAPYTEAEIRANLDAMKAAGFGGFRIYPVYAFPDARAPAGVRNAPYLSNAFLKLEAAAVSHGRDIGLAPEAFLASGWPYGGPYIRPELGAGQLKYYSREIQGLYDGHVPGDWKAPERLLAVQAAPVAQDGIDAASLVDLTARIGGDGALRWQAPPGRWLLMTFVGGFTGMKVKRAAPGGEGLVLDHFNRAALDLHLERNGDVQKPALAGALAVGLDSWELFGSNWTPKLPEEFERRRGYSLVPHLAAIFLPCGDRGARVRYDFRRTLSELALENFFRPLAAWAHAAGLKLRAQAHGTPADILEAYGASDFPEGESYGPEDRPIRIRDRKLASSAAHLFGRRQVSCESFTWLRFPMFRVTLEDMKAAADAIYLDGVNQVNYHGVPLSPDWARPPGFFFYAATFAGRGNTWWPYLHLLSDYLRRANYLLQQGDPVADVAVYAPLEDAWSNAFGPWYDLAGAVDSRLAENGSTGMLASLRQAGFDFDFIDARRLAEARIERGALAAGPMRYRIVVLPEIEAIEPESLERLRDFCRAGGTLIAAGRLPERAPGLRDAAREDARVTALARELFASGEPWRGERVIRGGRFGAGLALFVPPDPARNISPPENAVARAVSMVLAPDFAPEGFPAPLGFVHRRADARDVYLVANRGPAASRVRARFRRGAARPVLLDAQTGSATPAPQFRTFADRTEVTFDLPPRGSVFVLFEPAATGGAHEAPPPPASRTAAVPGPWRLARPGTDPISLRELTDWTTLPGYRDFSGTAAYTTTLRVPAAWRRPGMRLLLDLGEVEDIADVSLNGRPAGVAWKHPYVLDITHAARPGANRLEVRVTNRLLNPMLAHEPDLPPPYYRLRDYISIPAPSGLRGPVLLRAVGPH